MKHKERSITTSMALQEQDRKRLDGIVNQMVSNGESDKNIQTVVNDFKSRNVSSNKSTALQKTAGVGESLGLKPVADVFAKGIQSGSAIASLLAGNKEGFNQKQAIADQVDSPSARELVGSIASTALLAGGGAGKVPGTLLGKAAFGSGLGATSAASVATAQGKDTKETAKATLGGAIIGGVLPIAFEGGKIVLKTAGKGAANLFGIGTGQGGQVLQETARRSASGKTEALKQFRKGRDVLDITEEAKGAMKQIKTARNTAYQKDFSLLDTGAKLDISSAKASIKNKLIKDIGAKVKDAKLKGVVLKDGILTPTKATKGTINLTQSSLDKEGASVVESAFKAITGKKDMSVKGLDRLQQKLGRIANKAQPGSAEQQFSIEAQSGIKDILIKEVPGYQKLLKDYGATTKALNTAEVILGLGKNKKLGGVNEATALNKLMSSFKENRSVQLKILNELSEKSGVDLTGMVVGAAGRPFIPQSGVGRALLSSAATTAPFTGAINLPQVAGVAGITSPRIASQVASSAGGSARILNQLLQSQGGQQARRLIPQLLGAQQANRR